jgi:type IV secretion system protein TrbB
MNAAVLPTPMEDIGEQERRFREKLKRELGPLVGGLLDDDLVIEVMLNPDGVVWVERLGEAMKAVGVMQPSAARSVLTTVAATLGTEVNREKPILECELPVPGAPRFEALLPPLVRAPSFTIRRKATKIFTADDYVTAGIMSASQRRVIGDAVRNRLNILVAGGTGTGKTTLANAILHEISEVDPESRLVIIEDTGELQCAAKNKVEMRTRVGISMRDLLKVTMRMRPDRIIVGEVRDGSANDLIKAWNTGHPGGAATIHSNVAKPEGALARLEDLVAEVVAGDARSRIGEAINVIVTIAKTANGRRVQSVTQVHGFNGTNYQLTNME